MKFHFYLVFLCQEESLKLFLQSLGKYFSSILFRPRDKTSWRRRRYVSKETPNHVLVERHQDFSVVLFHAVLLVCRDDVSRGHNDNVPSVRLPDFSNKSQMKHPTTSQWCVTKKSQWYISKTSCTSLQVLL